MQYPKWLELPYCDCAEEIDRPDQSYDDIAKSMRDLARINRFFAGTSLVQHHLKNLLNRVNWSRSVTLLDIATGSADIPGSLIKWAASFDINLSIVGTDNCAPMLRLAVDDNPSVMLVQAEANAIPFQDNSFDFVTCALAFHHLGFDRSVRLLREMDRLSVHGFLVSDLIRNKITHWFVRIGMFVLRTHPFTRHDGPASVRRSFTRREYERMIALSGLQNVRIIGHPYGRIALVLDKTSS